MKRNSLILCLFLIICLSGVASAQIVLGPPPAAAGGVVIYNITLGGTTVSSAYSIYTFPVVGGMAYAGTTGGVGFSYYVAAHGAIEFNLGAATFPTTMTSKNFTAMLDGLSATDFVGSGAIKVDLFDMGDGTEDGVIYVGDFNSTRGSRIARRTHTFGGAPADFIDIDVTCAVRNDLFGAG